VWRAKDRLVNLVTRWKPNRKDQQDDQDSDGVNDRVKEDLNLGIRDGETRALNKEAW